MRRLSISLRSGMAALLVGGALAGFVPIAGAQTAGGGGGGISAGGGGGGGATSLGGTGLGSTGGIGSSATIGSGNISALKNGAAGLSSLSITTTAASGAIPAPSDPFLPFYSGPIHAPSATSSATTFAVPQYPITTSNTATFKTSATKATNTGFTTFNYRKNPVYATTLSEDVPLVSHPALQLRTEVQDVLARSSDLKPTSQIEVSVLDGGLVVLSGNVSTARERRLAGNLISITPGVRRVQNQLNVNP